MDETATQIGLQEAATPLILALDIGSSSARAGLVDGAGHRVAESLVQTKYDLHTTPDGGAELDPNLLFTVIENLIDDALRMADARQGDIAAVAVSTFWHSVLGIDAACDSITPLYTWADTRAASEVARLRERLDQTAYHARTGARLHPSYLPAKLAWIRRTAPQIWQRAARWLSFGEYVFLRLFGDATCSTSMASGTGLFGQAAQAWDAETLRALSLDEGMLSPINDAPVSTLLPEFAHRWPALRGARWFPALGDGACSNAGSGAAGPDRLALMVGTTGALRLLWEGAPISPPAGLWLYRLDARRVLLGGAISEGGNLYEWLDERLRLPAGAALLDALDALPPDGHGLTWLPFLAGERSPNWRGDVRATITGLTLDTSPIEILRAGLEAVAYRFGLIAELLRTAAPGDHLLIASGNALLSNPVWVQIMADTLSHPIVLAREREASLRGAALMALERLGAIEDLAATGASVLHDAPRFEPNPTNHAIYKAAIARQRDLYRRLIAADASTPPTRSPA